MIPLLFISNLLFVSSFTPNHVQTRRFRAAQLRPSNSDDSLVNQGPERSKMIDFISDFLRKESDRTTSSSSSPSPFTHLIAIPVDTNHELMLELESVQRAILYHCPVLVHACITAAMTRLPLIYVQTDQSASATSRLHDIVEDVVHRNVFEALEEEPVPNEVQRVDGQPDITGANEEGIQPLMMSFQSLEIDGSGNEVLCTVGDRKSAGTRKLQRIVNQLQEQIADKTGWKTTLPLDPHSETFRPRVPFMRLPDDWVSHLDVDPDNPDAFLTSDQGGNGISPILWGQWMDDQFGEETRMREVAIYKRRTSAAGLAEQAFNLPDRSIPLPAGNAALSRSESRFQQYQESRMAEAEQLDRGETTSPIDVADDDPMLVRTRNRLDSLYKGGKDTASRTLSSGVWDDLIAGEVLEFVEPKSQPSKSTRSEDDSVDDLTKERIRQTVESRARLQTEKALSQPKMKPPIAENPVFAKYKDGSLVPEQEKPPPPKDLPPYPSREHCVGFWRVVSSPTGFAVEEGDSSRSDNLILRVDGTTAGGPILDVETRQKASGGNWRLLVDTAQNAELRIRLIIPPKKDRVLVMQGKLQRASMSSDFPMAKGTFGIPSLEERAKQSSSGIQDLIYCSGTVRLEDDITGLNSEDIGTFSIMKLDTPADPSQFTITIPKPVRNQD